MIFKGLFWTHFKQQKKNRELEVEVKIEPEPERSPSTPEKLPSPSTPVSDIKENVLNDAEKTPVSNLEGITGPIDDGDKTTIKTERKGRRKARIVYSRDKAALMGAKNPAAQDNEEEEEDDDDDDVEEEGEEEEEKTQAAKSAKESSTQDPKDVIQTHSCQSPKTSSENVAESDRSSKPSRAYVKRSRLSVASPVTTEDHSSTKPVNRSKAQLLTRVSAIASSCFI